MYGSNFYESYVRFLTKNLAFQDPPSLKFHNRTDIIIGTHCQMANGEAVTGCNEVDTSCNQGCSRSDIRYKCKSNFGYDSYILWDCGPAFVNLVCTHRLNQHLYGGFHCTTCCINKNCGLWGTPMCFSQTILFIDDHKLDQGLLFLVWTQSENLQLLQA